MKDTSTPLNGMSGTYYHYDYTDGEYNFNDTIFTHSNVPSSDNATSTK